MAKKHALILGTGITGASVAEILTRNGWRVTLVEKNDYLGGDASLNTQNWFHTGWLYAALPYESAMAGCHKALNLYRHIYEPVLPAGTVNVEFGGGSVDYPASDHGWFNDERIHFVFATRSKDLNFWQRASWQSYLRTVPLRRLRKIGYPIEVVDCPPDGLKMLLNYWEESETGFKRYMVVRSTDARLETRRVLASLIGLTGADTEVVTGADSRLVTRKGRTEVEVNGLTYAPDLVVVAAGRGIPEFARQVGREDVSQKIKSVCSPIIVLRQVLNLPNFIRFTPNLPQTLNHIRYTIPNFGETTTLGSYDFFPVDNAPDISAFSSKMCTRMNISEEQVLGCYYGTKTEYTGKVARRYNHAVERLNENTYMAIAGKFSQFPLLVDDFADQMNLATDIVGEDRGICEAAIGLTSPERIMSTRLEQLDTVNEEAFEGCARLISIWQ